MRSLIVLLLPIGLIACTAGTNIEVTPPPSIDVYHPSSPAPVETRPVLWEVLTRQQLLELIEQAEADRQPLTLYALREQHFENLAINIQELKRYILESRAVIDYYRRVLPDHLPVESSGTTTTRQTNIRVEKSTITPEQRELTEKLYNFAR